jgi:hypothetical protein
MGAARQSASRSAVTATRRTVVDSFKHAGEVAGQETGEFLAADEDQGLAGGDSRALDPGLVVVTRIPRVAPSLSIVPYKSRTGPGGIWAPHRLTWMTILPPRIGSVSLA